MRLPELAQYTASGSSSSLSSCRTEKRTNTRSRMSPTRSNGRHSCCSHTGMNPLFLTTPVRHVTVRADVAAVVEPAVGGLYAAAGVAVAVVAVVVVGESVGRKGECVQSGMWIDTSTNGSMTDLSMISRPCESLGRGSCCAEMTYRLDAYSQLTGPKDSCVDKGAR